MFRKLINGIKKAISRYQGKRNSYSGNVRKLPESCLVIVSKQLNVIVLENGLKVFRKLINGINKRSDDDARRKTEKA
jgi:hypothetical protein